MAKQKRAASDDDEKESKKKKIEKKRTKPDSGVEKWPPQDDFFLIEAAQQGLDPEEILGICKFSQIYSTDEILERWKEILYDETIAQQSARIVNAFKNPNKRALWSEEEDALIMSEMKKNGPVQFASLLSKNRSVFHPMRTVKTLEGHYWKLKRSIGNTTGSGNVDEDGDIDNYESIEAQVLET